MLKRELKLLHLKPQREKVKPDSSGIHLIIGLGNPGSEYEKTRHNAGFLVVDALSGSSGTQFKKPFLRPWLQSKFLHESAEAGSVILVKPLTYMNRSGSIVPSLLKSHRTDLNSLIVIYDTLDLPAGRIRIRSSGSGGGQKGLNSMIEHLGSDLFTRIAVGIGRPARKDEVISWVLGEPDGEALKSFRQGIGTAAEAAEALCVNPVDQVMSMYNGRK